MQQCSKTIQKTINVDDVTKEIIKELNPDLPQIPVNPYKMLITEGCGSGKTFIIHFNKSSTRY